MANAAVGEPGAAVVVLAATIGAIVAFVALHALPTGLSPRRHAVSHYGITRYRPGYRVLTLTLGVAGIAAGAGIAAALPNDVPHTDAVVWLVIFGMSRLPISWFAMDEPGSPRTEHAIVHGLLALVTFVSVTVASFQLRRSIAAAPARNGVTSSAYLTALDVTSVVLLVGLIATVLARRAAPDWFGAAERLIYLGTFALLLATGVALT